MQRVDAHVHVFDRPSLAFPRQVTSLAPAGRMATAEQLLREMDAAAIDRAVLVQLGGTEIDYHRYLTWCVEQWPERFTAVGLVDLDDPDPPARLRELSQATAIEGVRLMGELGDPTLSRAEALRAYGLFECADALGLNVNLYCPCTQVECVELLARAFPQVNISLDHLGICPSTAFVPDQWGRPRFEDEPIPPPSYPRILDLAQYPNVYFKISGEYAFSKVGYPYPDMRPMVEQIYAACGPGRMMWGSDFPWIAEVPGYGRLVELIDRHLPDLSAGERAEIMGGTALKIWFRGD